MEIKAKTATWFEAKVRYQKTMESGATKYVTETYVVDALSWTEAEARVIEEVKPFVSGDFEIMAIGKAKYKEIYFNEGEDAEKWFKCVIGLITLDEKTAEEKQSNMLVLAQAKNTASAQDVVNHVMGGSVCDYVIDAVTTTRIKDIFCHA